MKLYNLDHSPYATRVRIQAYVKALPVDIEAPPMPLRTPEFADRFPMAKIPVLQLDDGQEIGDSWAIMEYLEDTVPEPSLRPTDPLAHAAMNQLMRCSDTAFGPAGLFPLFRMVSSPEAREDADAELAAMAGEIARLERLLGALPDCRERGLHLGRHRPGPESGVLAGPGAAVRCGRITGGLPGTRQLVAVGKRTSGCCTGAG